MMSPSSADAAAKRAPRLGYPGRLVRRLVHRYFGGVSQRVTVIILLATLPLAALSAVTAWQTYDTVRDQNIARAREIRDRLIARGRIQTQVATNVLSRLAGSDRAMEAGRCSELLHFVVALDLLHRTRLSILDADRNVICSDASSDMPIDPGLRTIPSPPPGQVAIRPAASETLTLDIVSSPQAPAGAAALLVAQIELGWSKARAGEIPGDRGIDLDGVQVWLRFADGQVHAICADCGWTSPSPALWPARPGAAPQGTVGHENYAAGPIAYGVDVLVVTRPRASDAQALAAFYLRVIEIALILGAALLLVVVAANLAIVAPIDDLTGAVARWRAGGVFQRSRMVLMPNELRRLWEAFAAATDTLSRHEARLAEAEVKQALLIKEIHHRVKNNLQIIASLLNLQASRIKQPDSRAEFASARDRVRALATLHRHLYQEGEPETMRLRSFLEELCAQLFQAMGERPNGRIRLEIDAPDLEMPADQAVPTALVVTEAVSNAIKYAFPAGRSGRIAVSLQECPDSETLRLVIEDDGIGIPEGPAETESGVRDGLGIQLIRGFARQLGAELAVVRDGGTTYTLSIPRRVASRGVRL